MTKRDTGREERTTDHRSLTSLHSHRSSLIASSIPSVSPTGSIPLPHLVGCRHEVTALPANRREVRGMGPCLSHAPLLSFTPVA